MAISVALAIMFPYIDYNDPGRSSNQQTSSTSQGNRDNDSSQDVKESSIDTSTATNANAGSGGNHQPNLFDNEGDIDEDLTTPASSLPSQNAANDALSATGTQTTISEKSSCQALLILADADSNGMIDSTEYRNFIDELKVSDYLAASSTVTDSLANFDFGAYSSALNGLPTSLKLKFLSLSSSSSTYCLDNEITTTTVICIGEKNDNANGSSSSNADLDDICDETMQVMEEIVGGRI